MRVRNLAGFAWNRWLKRGTFEWLDIWATVLGGVLGAVILHAAR